MDKLPLKLLGDNPVTHPGQDRLGFLRFVEPFADRILASRAHAPVTVAQFRPFVEQDGYSDADYWTRDGWSWRQEEKRTQPDLWDDADHALDNHPVVGVTWYEAVAWCNWLTARLRQQGVLPEGMLIRLPTEAEWEWAARGSEGLRWPWGEDWLEDEVMCNGEEAGLGASSAVGLFPPGRADALDPNLELPVPGERAEGLFDQAGNVWEWCATRWQEEYPSPEADEWLEDYLAGSDPRALRGGAYWNDRAGVRGASRRRVNPWDWNVLGGFRSFGSQAPAWEPPSKLQLRCRCGKLELPKTKFLSWSLGTRETESRLPTTAPEPARPWAGRLTGPPGAPTSGRPRREAPFTAPRSAPTPLPRGPGALPNSDGAA